MHQFFNILLFSYLTIVVLTAQTQISFECTGKLQSYTIPVNVTKLTVEICGAYGGGPSGGQGQCLSLSQIPVTAGQVLYIAVGCQGGKNGGYNGGGAGSGYGFGGGGASDIRTLPSNLTSRIIVAAGGGGTGYDGTTYNRGGSGNTTSGSGSGYGGLAKLNAGGTGGKYFGDPNGYTGAFGLGGAASTNGGGGGGGWYGGGGATYNGGGGGGSSYYSVGTKSSSYLSYYYNGSVVITPFKQYTITVSNNSDATTPFYFPSDVTSINVAMAGAQGGSTSTGRGGKGGYISATVTGSTFSSYGVYVTIGGTDGNTGGGMPTSSAYCRLGGVGGGFTTVSYYVSNHYTTVLVAAGGGGAGFDPYCGTSCNSSSINGGSGGPAGSNGRGSPVMASSYGGKGGTATTGGVGGFYNSSYKSGSSGYSYHGGSPASDSCGGGGGAGYYGGGGGSFTGGGGGSSYYYPSTVSNLVQAAGANAGGGYVTFTYLSAVSTQPTPRPNPRPTIAPITSTFPDDFSDDALSTVPLIVPIIIAILGCCCCCACCFYCHDQAKRSAFFGRNITVPTTYTQNPVRAVALPTTTTTSRTGPKKIDSAVTIMTQFLSSMMGARDRCSIVSFSDQYNIRQNLSASAPCISSLNACRYATGGGTALYDAAVASVVQFAATAERTRPWLLIILTDGEDTNSRTKSSELIEVLKLFNQASSNFVFIVGLGRSLQDTELRRICEQSKSLYLRATDIETMQLMFALIALVVIEQNQVQIARVQAEGVDAIFARARTARAVATVPIDMIILLDTSGSMDDPA